MLIRRDDLSGPEIRALLAEHLANMHAITPRESVHALDLDGLRRPEITFWTAWSDGALAGCGALKEIDAGHGEIKSMRTANAHRRRGVGRAVLDHIVGEARRRGYARLSLETGAMREFEPARTLYARAGFAPCPPFAGYRDDPNSVFMTLALPAAPTMTTPDDAKRRAATTYNAAADHYDDPANAFWARYGRTTVERLALAPGMHVLDVCCGSGASALPAAQAVGPGGSVTGVDLAANLLALARAKAASLGLRHATFREGDMLDLKLGGERFDAVVCVFGVFFVPDMASAVRSLWSAVRPGGRLAITTWGPGFFEPATTGFWSSIREVRPDLFKGFNPWDRICDPPSLAALLREGGIADADVVAVAGTHPIPSPDAWWSAVMGSGYRGTVDQLDAAQAARVREANRRYVDAHAPMAVEANVVYAVARKGAA